MTGGSAVLSRQQRGHRADQDAGGADPDDRVAGGEEVADVVERVREGDFGVRASGATVQRAVEGVGDTAGGGLAGGVEDQDDGVQSHGSAPFVTRIMEK